MSRPTSRSAVVIPVLWVLVALLAGCSGGGVRGPEEPAFRAAAEALPPLSSLDHSRLVQVTMEDLPAGLAAVGHDPADRPATHAFVPVAEAFLLAHPVFAAILDDPDEVTRAAEDRGIDLAEVHVAASTRGAEVFVGRDGEVSEFVTEPAHEDDEVTAANLLEEPGVDALLTAAEDLDLVVAVLYPNATPGMGDASRTPEWQAVLLGRGAADDTFWIIAAHDDAAAARRTAERFGGDLSPAFGGQPPGEVTVAEEGGTVTARVSGDARRWGLPIHTFGFAALVGAGDGDPGDEV